MKCQYNTCSGIFKKGINNYIDDIVSDIKCVYKDYMDKDISNELNLKPNVTNSFLKTVSSLIDNAFDVLSSSVDWDVEENREVKNECINIMREFDFLYRDLKVLFKVLSFIRLAESSKLKITLCGTRKISARSDSYFKCILGQYRGKYRRITVANDMSFINASPVCGGEA